MDQEAVAAPMPDSIDLLSGAAAISLFLFASDAPRDRRKIYHLAEKSRLPVFRLGNVVCARKSVLLEWIREQEKRGVDASTS
jgi:hypothetical protein